MQEMVLENRGASGWDSTHQSYEDLTALEMQAWSYELETQGVETESTSDSPLPSPPNRIEP